MGKICWSGGGGGGGGGGGLGGGWGLKGVSLIMFSVQRKSLCTYLTGVKCVCV